MNEKKETATILQDIEVNTKIKLSILWATVMFIYIYVDIIGFYRPGIIQEIISGKVWVFEITQAWALGVIILMTIPSLMVLLSLVLKAKVNRWVNIIMGTVHILIAISTAMTDNWVFYIFGSAVEIVLLAIIVWTAWKWPKIEEKPEVEHS
jgi:hypothetical protein